MHSVIIKGVTTSTFKRRGTIASLMDGRNANESMDVFLKLSQMGDI